MGRELATDRAEFQDMENAEFSDLDLVYHCRDILNSVLLGDKDDYDELVGHLHNKGKLTADEVALLATSLKALSGAVSYIDCVQHEALLFAIFRMSLWNYGTVVMDALLELVVSLAASNGKYVDLCLEMLVRNFIPPYHFLELLKQPRGLDKKDQVLSRVHAALKDIAGLVPLAPLRLCPIVIQRMPNAFSKEPEIVIYVENMLRLASGAFREVVGSTMLPALVDRMIELDVEIGWDGILQDDGKGIFEMDEDVAEPADEDEKDNNMLSGELLTRRSLQGNLVAEKLDSLLAMTFEHLESCCNSGSLGEVFNVLLASFQKTVLNAYKSKFTQFVMFYACALDLEDCGVKFAIFLTDMFANDINPPITRMSAVAYLASYLSRMKELPLVLVAGIVKRLVDWCCGYCKFHDDYMNPQAHQVFYSACQAIMYVLCFHMRSLVDVPRFKLQLFSMPIEPILKHKLSPLKVCLPTVVDEFLRQAKAAQLFTISESFIFNDLLESDLSRAYGGMDRLDMFFPFDPLLLKKSESIIRPYFLYWAKVGTTYDSDCEGNNSDEDDANVLDTFLEKMSITPKNSFKYERQSQECRRMPSRIRPSTSPESL